MWIATNRMVGLLWKQDGKSIQGRFSPELSMPDQLQFGDFYGYQSDFPMDQCLLGIHHPPAVVGGDSGCGRLPFTDRYLGLTTTTASFSPVKTRTCGLSTNNRKPIPKTTILSLPSRRTTVRFFPGPC